jgi:hypothetical protein
VRHRDASAAQVDIRNEALLRDKAAEQFRGHKFLFVMLVKLTYNSYLFKRFQSAASRPAARAVPCLALPRPTANRSCCCARRRAREWSSVHLCARAACVLLRACARACLSVRVRVCQPLQPSVRPALLWRVDLGAAPCTALRTRQPLMDHMCGIAMEDSAVRHSAHLQQPTDARV